MQLFFASVKSKIAFVHNGGINFETKTVLIFQEFIVDLVDFEPRRLTQTIDINVYSSNYYNIIKYYTPPLVKYFR